MTMRFFRRAFLLSCLSLLVCAEDIVVKDVAVIQSPNFPKGYSELLMVTPLYKLTTDPGFGLSFLFNRFAIGPADCLYFCPTDNGDCIKKSGTDLDNPLFFFNKSSVTVMLNSANPKRQYSGFQAQVRKIALDSQSYFACNSDVVDLSAQKGPYFIVSQNFGTGKPTTAGICNLRMNSKSRSTGIKVVVDRFRSLNNGAAMQLIGPDLNGVTSAQTVQNTDVPTAYYFTGYVQFVLAAPSTDYEHFAYAVTYDVSPATSSCNNVGTTDVRQVSKATFGSQNGTDGYGSNSICDWKYSHLPQNSQFALELQYDSERCCDALSIGGLATKKAVTLKGHTEYSFQYATEKELSLHFASDATEDYVGFNGTVHVLDCDCGNTKVKLFDMQNTAFVQSPGYSKNQSTYCQNIQCFWSIDYPRSSLLQRTVVGTDLYEMDTVQFLNFDGTTNFKDYDINGHASTAFTSNQKPDGLIKSPQDMRHGFSYKFKTFATNVRYIEVDLCADEVASFNSLWLQNQYDTVIYTFTTGCGKYMRIYPFFTEELEKTFLMSIFDGNLASGRPINFEKISESQEASPFVQMSSTFGTVKLVRIAASNTNNAQVFGLAKATFINGDCGTVNTLFTSASFNFKTNDNCNHLFYYHSTDYSAQSGLTNDILNNPGLTMYKGISKNVSHSVTGEKGELPSFVYGPFLTLHTTRDTSSFTVNVNQDLQATNLKLKVANTPAIIATSDFASDVTGLIDTTQTFTIEKLGFSRISVQMWKSLASNNWATVQNVVGNKIVKSKVYTSDDGAFGLNESADQLVINYFSNVTSPDGGIIATFQQGR